MQNASNIPHFDDVDNLNGVTLEGNAVNLIFFGTPGMKVVPKDPSCPLSILKTFLSDELVGEIVQYTNTYSYILKRESSYIEKVLNNRSLLNLWKDVSTDDMWIPIFSRLMRRDRFEQFAP